LFIKFQLQKVIVAVIVW